MRNLTPALTLIKAFEGLADGDPSTVALDPYLCPAGYWTIGWGHVVRDGRGRMLAGRAHRAAARVVYPRGITRAEAETLLLDDLRPRIATVERLVRVPLTDAQFGALLSFEYNTGALGGSSLLRRLNAGDYAAVPRELAKWVKARDPRTGQRVTLRGLVRRRAAEAALWSAA